MRYCKPYKNITPNQKTQGFHSEHLANDWASFHGDFIVAPFNAKVVNIRGVESVNDVVAGDNSFLEGGCGIKLQSTEDPTITISYWHCMTAFPVSRGDIVLQGQPIAQQGASGFVMSGGKYVPIDQRHVPPFKGSHSHITMGRTVGGTYTPLDYSAFIDWSIPVSYDAVTTIKALIAKIMGFLK